MTWEKEKAAHAAGKRIQGWSEQGMWTPCVSPSWSEAPGVKYRIYPDDEDKPDAGGRIRWEGGECPVPIYTQVEAELSCGEIHTRMAGAFRWWRTGGGSDIAAYRVVEPEQAPVPPGIPHADIIRAVLDGKTVQIFRTTDGWTDVAPTAANVAYIAGYPDGKFRIKPEPVVRWYPVTNEWYAERADCTEHAPGHKVVRAEFLDGKCVGVTLEDA